MNEGYETPREPYRTEWQEVEEKKHSVLGILSTSLAGFMLFGSLIALGLLTSAVGDYVTLSEETSYSYEEIINMVLLDGFTQEQEEMFEMADMKFGFSVFFAFLLGFGYLAGLVLGIIGVCKREHKKIYPIIGLVVNVVLPILFFIVAYNNFFAPLM
ncbi:hypothetical protein [Alkalihalobacillus sp. LMS39]|uniref:hypothetical protein n=1 Tax=Alkalihalobacillus sp. LMS39 TaxID=2924032 RepID=UPI001FB28FC9|nr:hypothetical protein [Alkalihalobacillus sp. LMS39]UOE94830.1 hypothetical protein MM271_04055 [Alkalihalobacillus sp. LMS39]